MESVSPLMTKMTHTKAALNIDQSPDLTSPSHFPGACHTQVYVTQAGTFQTA